MSATTNNCSFRILDGAFADELVRTHHLDGLRADPLWGAGCIHTHPSAIQAVHASYAQAGADVILTSTYQAHPDNLAKHLGLDYARSSALLRKGVQLALDAASSTAATRLKPQVAVSMGSHGATLSDGSEYTGTFVETLGGPDRALSALTAFHLLRLQAFGWATNEGGVLDQVQYLAFETVPSVVEVRAIAAAVNQFFRAHSAVTAPRPAWPQVWISVTCRSASETGAGDPIELVAREIHAAGHRVGINCTAPQHVAGALARIRQQVGPETEIVVYPNKGQHWDAVQRDWVAGSGMDDENFAHVAVHEWIKPYGPLLVGGCCQTTPETVAALHHARQRQATPLTE